MCRSTPKGSVFLHFLYNRQQDVDLCFSHAKPESSCATCCALDTRRLDVHELLMSFPFCYFKVWKKKTLSNSQFPSEVLNCRYKAAIKFPEYAFCLCLQMVSHAIKIFSVSKKPDGKVVNTRIFYALGQATSIPMCFSPLPIHKRSVFFFLSNKDFFPPLSSVPSMVSPHLSHCFTTTCPRVKKKKWNFCQRH